MKKTLEGWDSEVWDGISVRLLALDVDNLIVLANRCGIKFFTDESKLTKRDVVLVLDESDPDVLLLNLEELEQSTRT